MTRPVVLLADGSPRTYEWTCTDGHVRSGAADTLSAACDAAVAHYLASHAAWHRAPMTDKGISAWRRSADLRARRATLVRRYVESLR